MTTTPFTIPNTLVHTNSPIISPVEIVEGLQSFRIGATLTVPNPQATNWSTAQATNVTVDPQHQDWTDLTKTTLGPWITSGPTTFASGQLTGKGAMPGLVYETDVTPLMHAIRIVVSVDKNIQIGGAGSITTTP